MVRTSRILQVKYDEKVGASFVLLTAPERTDVYMFTDGSHGNKEKTVEEEALIRKEQSPGSSGRFRDVLQGHNEAESLSRMLLL